MKVTVKTISAGVINLEVPEPGKIRDVKEAIHAEKGDAFFVEGLKVIFAGKVLGDDETLVEKNFKEGDFLVVMASKGKPKAAAKPEEPKKEEAKPEATSSSVAESKPETTTSSSTTTETPAPTSESTTTAATTTTTAADTSAADAPTSGDTGNSDDSDAPKTLSADSPLAFLLENRQFMELRRIIHGQPRLLPSLLQHLAQQNPDLVQLLNSNQEDFYILLNQPLGGMPSMAPPQQPAGLQLSPEENAAIGRLCDLGFDRAMATQAYFACDKNENMAANWLFENSDF
jgi:UV excision repair protein RAD23